MQLGNGGEWIIRMAAPKLACIWPVHPEAQHKLRAFVPPIQWPIQWNGCAGLICGVLPDQYQHKSGFSDKKAGYPACATLIAVNTGRHG